MPSQNGTNLEVLQNKVTNKRRPVKFSYKMITKKIVRTMPT